MLACALTAYKYVTFMVGKRKNTVFGAKFLCYVTSFQCQVGCFDFDLYL